MLKCYWTKICHIFIYISESQHYAHKIVLIDFYLHPMKNVTTELKCPENKNLFNTHVAYLYSVVVTLQKSTVL